MRIALGIAIALMLGASQADAGMLDNLKGFFGAGNPIVCDAADAKCIANYAANILANPGSDTTVNDYGAALGHMWQHLSPEARDRLLADFAKTPEGDGVENYVLIGRAQVAPDPLTIDDLSKLLEHPDRSGELPLNYYAQTLVASLLETDPAAVADLAVKSGDAFEATAKDGLSRTIAWMAHNDPDRLDAYLQANDPPSTNYFNVHQFLFAVAAKSCATGDKAGGDRLRAMAKADLVKTRITPSERFALPIPALLACEGLNAALAAKDDLLPWLPKDVQRLSALDDAMTSQMLLERLTRTVNGSALVPLVRALHQAGREADAEALASQMLPLTQTTISIDADAQVSVEHGEIQQTLDEMLQGDDTDSTSLDPVIALDWFDNSFDPKACCSPASYAESIIDPIVAVWPSDAAKKAAGIALPLLDANEQDRSAANSLRLNIARRSLTDCVLSQPQLQAILDRIGAQEPGLDQVIRIADYLTYLDRRGHSNATAQCPDL